MKRIYLLLVMAMVVVTTSVVISFNEETETVQAEETENNVHVSSAKSVIVPYLDMDINELSCIRKEEEIVTNRLLTKGNFEGVSEAEPFVGETEQNTGGFNDSGSESRESTSILCSGGAGEEGGDVNERAAVQITDDATGDFGEASGDNGELSGSDAETECTGAEDESDVLGYDSCDSGLDESGPTYTYLGDWITTAYCPCEQCCGQWATGCTASGVLASSNHTVACGILDFGTQIMIDGVIYTVEDRGVDGEWVDIFFDTHEEALAYGMHTKSVYLVN